MPFTTEKTPLLKSTKEKTLQQSNFNSQPKNLLELPEDILITIMAYLSMEDIAAIFKTCKQLYILSDSKKLWHFIAKNNTSVQKYFSYLNQQIITIPQQKNKTKFPVKKWLFYLAIGSFVLGLIFLGLGVSYIAYNPLNDSARKVFGATLILLGMLFSGIPLMFLGLIKYGQYIKNVPLNTELNFFKSSLKKLNEKTGLENILNESKSKIDIQGTKNSKEYKYLEEDQEGPKIQQDLGPPDIIEEFFIQGYVKI